MVIKDRLTDAAGIASSVAAGIYGGRILRRSIESDRRNFTRFFLLRNPEYALRHPFPGRAAFPGKRRSFSAPVIFPARFSRLERIRPSRSQSHQDRVATSLRGKPLREYLFYLDFLGRVDAPNAQNALNHLREIADVLTVLGSYPKGA